MSSKPVVARHRHRPVAAQVPGTQSLRDRLVVVVRQLGIEPLVQVLDGHRRSVLGSPEQPDGSVLARHVHRIEGLGAGALINKICS